MWILGLVWAFAGEASSLTLAAALAEATRDNPEYAAVRLGAERARLALLSSGSQLGPQLSASVLVDQDGTLSWQGGASERLPGGGSLSVSLVKPTPDTGVSPTVTLIQPLLEGTRGLGALRSARLEAADEALAARAALEGLTLSVSASYWSLVAARESRTYADQSVLFAEQQHRATEERLSEGFAGSGDLLQVRRALGVARQAAVIAASEEENAELSFARLLGRDLATRPHLVLVDRPEPPAELPERDQILEAARLANTTWLRASLSRDVAEEAFKQARVAALPSLDASTSWAGAPLASEGGGAQSWALGLSLSAPLVPVSIITELQRARLAWEQAELAWYAAEQDLVLAVEAAVREVRRDRLRLSLASETLAAAEAGLAADQSLLVDGRGSARDVVRSLESLNAAQVDRLRTEIALQSSMLELERIRGSLLGRLGLEPQRGR